MPLVNFTKFNLSQLREIAGDLERQMSKLLLGTGGELGTPPIDPPIDPPTGGGFLIGMNADLGQDGEPGFTQRNRDATLEIKPPTESVRVNAHVGDFASNVNWANNNGMTVLLMLGYGHGIDIRTAGGRQAYAERSAGHAQTFGNKVRYYQVWNEWNGGFGMGPDVDHNDPPANDPGMYTDLLKRCYIAMKDVNPNIKVAGGVIAGSNLGFLQGMLNAGARQYMDVLDLHCYPYRQTWSGHVAEDAPGSVGCDKLFEVLRARWNTVKNQTGQPIDIIVTETGCPVKFGLGIQADYLREIYTRGPKELPFLRGIWWWPIRDGNREMGILTEDGVKRPSWHAYKALAS